ncbi:MAG: porin, partial [Candidatus Anammoximicrobium sp.]|nr:porin [Candidatus Anammoximicrobium sp.]
PVWPSPAAAPQRHPAEAATAPQADFLTAADGVANPPSAAAMLQRLNEAEATIAALKAQLPQEPGGGSAPDSVIGFLGQRWKRLGDPELELVNYSTCSAMRVDPSPKPWYDKYSLRGYTQVRINESMGEDDGSALPHHVGDRSVSPNQGFLIRRARLVLAGDVSEHMSIYLQGDLAASVSNPDTHFAQIRDWYADLYLDACKVYRIRLGQSKVPYGWENMQSSSNRIPLDRDDALNSAVRNERDLGVFFYWTPEFAQDFFKEVLDLGLKGSGNYGLFGLGVYDGQGGSLVEQNDNLHLVARLTLPFTLATDQHVEIGVQAYTGKYTVLTSPIAPLGVGATAAPASRPAGILDERIGGTFVWYPQPVGFQAEWNVGRGPSLDEAQTRVVERSLTGGYAMTMVRVAGPWGGDLFPFLRWVCYEGGYKGERNAPYSEIDEWELGCEWQLNPQMEFTAIYTITDRTNTTPVNKTDVASYGQYDGQILRFQFQVNY